MNNISGFLDLDGILYSCHSYEHLDKAEELIQQFKIEKRSGELAEDALLHCGWICIRAHDVYKSAYDSDNNILFITEKQQEFFKKNEEKFNQRQLSHIEQMLKDFGCLYKFHIK